MKMASTKTSSSHAGLPLKDDTSYSGRNYHFFHGQHHLHLKYERLTPGISTNMVIDYTSISGIKQWTEATCQLEDELYNVYANLLHGF